ncbi:plasmid recombination protein [Pseudorhodobacter turbinis]|nr:plasmid recombination protein [Pseudorhodobacter turbinis]
MSIQPEFDNPQIAAIRTIPIVLRFQGLHPGNLGRFVMHDKRKGGDLSHVDLDATSLNEPLFGEADWKKTLLAEIKQAKHSNLRVHIEALQAKSRKKEASQRQLEGLLDPWQRCANGPLREGIITVNKSWFGGTGHAGWDPEKVDQFRDAALSFLEQHFPNGELRYASGHADEEAYHIHFVVAVWRERFTLNRGLQYLLQASMNPLIASYEHAQNLAGEAFTDLGITRGERRAAARRDAKAANEPMPEKRRHVSPSQWRGEQVEQAHMEAGKIVSAAEATSVEAQAALSDAKQVLAASKQTAETIIEDGRTLAKATVRKSRKRAIKEAHARKAAMERENAAETQQLETVKALAAQKAIAARAAEEEQAAAAAMLIEYVNKLSAAQDKAQGWFDRTLVQKAAETEALKAAQEERSKLELANEQASGEVTAINLEKGRVSAGLQEAARDLKTVQDEVLAEQAAVQTAKEALEVINRRKVAGEEALEDVQLALKDTEAKKVEVESMIIAVEDGIKLIADGMILRNDMPGQDKPLKWGPAAPKDKEARDGLLKKIRPAWSLISRIAKVISEAVQTLVKAERQKLAQEAAYVAGLRDDWDAEQRAKLEAISKPPAPDW